MLRFRQMKSLQKFVSVHAHVHNHFNLVRHLIDRQTYKNRRPAVLAEWQDLMTSTTEWVGQALPGGDELPLG